MNPTFTVEARIAKPIAIVYEAVADPATLSRYFTTGGAKGRMETGAVVTWDFHDFPGAFPVKVVEAVPEQRIVFHWASSEDAEKSDGAPPPDAETTVIMLFESLEDGRTMISVSESGWSATDAGFWASYDNCYGWTQMVCALKAYLEYGINLRQGMFI